MLPFDLNLRFEARHGVIEDFTVDKSSGISALKTTSLYDVPDWTKQLAQAGMADDNAAKVGSWMNHVLGNQFTRPTQ